MVTLIMPRTLDKKPYRLRARFKIEPRPTESRLDAEKVRVGEMFVRDMHLQGWEYVSQYGFRMTGPFVPVQPMNIRPQRIMPAREMLPRVMRGERFLDKGRDYATLVKPLHESEYWEYEIAGVFSRIQILTEVPDAHEEERG